MFWGVISFAAMALFRSSVLLEKAPLPKKVNKVNYNWKDWNLHVGGLVQIVLAKVISLYILILMSLQIMVQVVGALSHHVLRLGHQIIDKVRRLLF